MYRVIKWLLYFLFGADKRKRGMVTSYLLGLPFFFVSMPIAGFAELLYGNIIKKNGMKLVGYESYVLAILFIIIGIVAFLYWVHLLRWRLKESSGKT